MYVDGADDVDLALRSARADVGDQAEVEQHHAPVAASTSTFDGLMSRCTLPRGVQRAQRRARAARSAARSRASSKRAPPAAASSARVDVGARVGVARPAAGVVDAARRRAAPGRTQLEEVDAVDQLHGEEPLRRRREQLAEAHQVGVVQVLQRAELAA